MRRLATVWILRPLKLFPPVRRIPERNSLTIFGESVDVKFSARSCGLAEAVALGNLWAMARSSQRHRVFIRVCAAHFVRLG